MRLMRLLLDTHALLWWLDDTGKLSPEARRAVADPENVVFVSAASAWEIAIKQAMGKLPAREDLLQEIDRNGFFSLPNGMHSPERKLAVFACAGSWARLT
jgi:PIN domain nuclease of toxin-antitoxin system